MKILHVVEASFAGVGRHVLDLAGTQAGAGHVVGVAYSPIRESESFRSERHALACVEWHEIAMSRGIGVADLASLRALRRLVAATEPDVIHGHSTKGGLLVRLLPRHGRVVYTPNAVYSMNPLLGARSRKIIALIERLLARRTDVVIAVSPEEESHLLSIGVEANRIRLIPNGIQPVARSDRDQVREALCLPVDKPIIGFVGRLDEQKAPDDLLAIYSEVARARPDAHFVVVGDGPQRGLVEQAQSEAGPLAGRLHVVGEQPGTWATSGFDLFLLPSRYEGFPYVLIEAAHLAVPIVTTAEACASLLQSGPGDIRVGSAGNIAQLAEYCLAALAESTPGSGGRGDRRFTVDAMARMAEHAYRGEAVDSVATYGG